MRTFIFTLLVLVTVIGVWVLTHPNTPTSPRIIPATPIPSSPPPGKVVYIGEKAYRIFLQKIADPGILTLIPNFSEKKTAGQIMREHNCIYGANAGFYTTDGKPLGLYYINGKYINSIPHAEPLFNGYVHKTNGGLFLIIDTPPHYTANALEFAFQSGPLFRPETRLALTSDEPTRRILIGKTDQEEYYFLGITDADNIHSGPYLVDLPRIIQQYNNETMQQFVLLLNLDGGAASAFFSADGIRLEELTPVGSFFCAR